MGQKHLFDVDVARQYGIAEAILLENIYFWVQKNEANEEHYHDGHYWTYNSAAAFHELFPYLSKDKIHRTLHKLESDGLILIGNYNKDARDRTGWYTLSEAAICILQNREMSVAESQNTFCKNAKSTIYRYKQTDINTDNMDAHTQKESSKRFSPPTVEEVEAYCRERQNGIDARRFVDYYTANGWKVGKNAMKDWRAAVRTWERNQTQGGRQAAKDSGAKSFETDEFFMAAVNAQRRES